MKTICVNRQGDVLYEFEGVNHRSAEMMIQNDLRVWTYKVIDENGICIYVR